MFADTDDLNGLFKSNIFLYNSAMNRHTKIYYLFLWFFGLAFIGAGVNHFANAEFYLAMMPPYLPLHKELVFLSGLAEIALGVLLLVPETRRLARLPIQLVLIGCVWVFARGSRKTPPESSSTAPSPLQ